MSQPLKPQRHLANSEKWPPASAHQLRSSIFAPPDDAAVPARQMALFPNLSAVVARSRDFPKNSLYPSIQQLPNCQVGRPVNLASCQSVSRPSAVVRGQLCKGADATSAQVTGHRSGATNNPSATLTLDWSAGQYDLVSRDGQIEPKHQIAINQFNV